MAPDLLICTSTIGESIDRGSVCTEELTPGMTSNSSNSCTPHSVATAGSSALSLRLVRPWSSQNSHSGTPRNSGPSSGQNSCVNLIATAVRPRVAPNVTPKTHGPLCNLSCRDKESMEEEILQLKKALHEKEMELRRRKVHATNIEAENRKLAKDIETLEVNLSTEGPRTGSPRRLRSKIAGLKALLEEAHNTCESQAIELYELRRSVRLSHARELGVERNVYAAEVHRLQQVVNKLKSVNGRIGHENRVVGRLKAKNHHLEVMNLRLSSCLSASLSQRPRTPRTPAQRDALVRSSLCHLDSMQQHVQEWSSRGEVKVTSNQAREFKISNVPHLVIQDCKKLRSELWAHKMLSISITNPLRTRSPSTG